MSSKIVHRDTHMNCKTVQSYFNSHARLQQIADGFSQEVSSRHLAIISNPNAAWYLPTNGNSTAISFILKNVRSRTCLVIFLNLSDTANVSDN